MGARRIVTLTLIAVCALLLAGAVGVVELATVPTSVARGRHESVARPTGTKSGNRLALDLLKLNRRCARR